MGAEGTIYAQFAFDENLSGRLRVEQGRALVSTCLLVSLLHKDTFMLCES